MRMLLRMIPPTTNIQQIHAPLRQYLSQAYRILDLPALHVLLLLQPVGSADAQEERHVLWDRFAGQIDDLEGEAYAVFEGATIRIGAVIGGGGDE